MRARLETQCMQRASENVHQIQKEFFMMAFIEPTKGVMAHMTAVETLAAKLNQLGISTTEQAVIGKILATLPRDFHVVSKCFESMAKEEKTLETIRSKLAKEEKILKRQLEEDNRRPSKDTEALVSYGSPDP